MRSTRCTVRVQYNYINAQVHVNVHVNVHVHTCTVHVNVHVHTVHLHVLFTWYSSPKIGIILCEVSPIYTYSIYEYIPVYIGVTRNTSLLRVAPRQHEFSSAGIFSVTWQSLGKSWAWRRWKRLSRLESSSIPRRLPTSARCMKQRWLLSWSSMALCKRRCQRLFAAWLLKGSKLARRRRLWTVAQRSDHHASIFMSSCMHALITSSPSTSQLESMRHWSGTELDCIHGSLTNSATVRCELISTYALLASIVLCCIAPYSEGVT